jgi:AbrB family looped-hinge helix DNA binding protein
MTNVSDKDFYGTTTIGERGQVVIPMDARTKMKISKGDKLLVFGMGKNVVALVKLEHIQEIADMLSKRLKTLDDIVKRSK